MTWYELLTRVESSPAFQTWRKENPSAFLSSVFLMVDQDRQHDFQVSYVHAENNTASTFTLDERTVVLTASCQPLIQQHARTVNELAMKDTFLTPGEVVALARERGKEEFGRFILLLENNPEPVWRVTGFSDQFTVLHLSLRAETGDVLEENLTDIMAFNQRQTP